MTQTLDTAKAELSKHINSKLFQKFLSKEAAKISEPVSLKPRRSPLRQRDKTEEERVRSVSRGLNKSVSNRASLKTFREISPVQNRASPVRFEKMQDLDISAVRRSHYDSPEANRVSWKPLEEAKSFIPVYTADPLLLKQLENDKKSLQDELQKTVDRFELQIRKKNEEFKRLVKQNEHLKSVNEELLAKLEVSDENERKVATAKAERDLMERKIHSLEVECDNYKRQIEHAKESCDNYKSQIDEYERSTRNKCQDVDRELRLAKDRNDDLERVLIREKERQTETERKLTKSKEKIFSLESDLQRFQEKCSKLERDLQEAKDRISHEAGQQLRETEGLRRKIEDLTQEILRRERNEEYRKKMYSPEYNFHPREPTRPRDFEEPPRRRDFAETSKIPEFRREESVKDFSRTREPRDFREPREDILTWQKKEVSRMPENLKGLEGKLMNLQMDKKRLEDELAKIPQTGKRLAQIKRQEEIQLELEILNSNIGTLRNKLRQAGAF
jgi:predicted RNase H-like nuclease (RuvC/YqgF family)